MIQKIFSSPAGLCYTFMSYLVPLVGKTNVGGVKDCKLSDELKIDPAS